MSSSSEEELDELLRRQVIRQPRNFEERRLFDIVVVYPSWRHFEFWLLIGREQKGNPLSQSERSFLLSTNQKPEFKVSPRGVDHYSTSKIQGNFERSFVSLWTPSSTFWN